MRMVVVSAPREEDEHRSSSSLSPQESALPHKPGDRPTPASLSIGAVPVDDDLYDDVPCTD